MISLFGHTTSSSKDSGCGRSHGASANQEVPVPRNASVPLLWIPWSWGNGRLSPGGKFVSASGAQGNWGDSFHGGEKNGREIGRGSCRGKRRFRWLASHLKKKKNNRVACVYVCSCS